MNYWVDMNYFAEFNWQLMKFKNNGKDPVDQTLSGTEISVDRIGLGRSIQNYQKLLPVVEIGKPFYAQDYLPRIPSVQAGKIQNRADYLKLGGGETMLLLPEFLSKWMRNCSVFMLKNSEKIELVDPCKQNYFNKLPSKNFILSIDKLFYKEVKVDNQTRINPSHGYTDFFVCSDENVLDVFCIPSTVKDFPLPDSGKAILKHLFILMKDRSKVQQIRKELEKLEALATSWHSGVYHFLYLRMDMQSGKASFPQIDKLQFVNVDASNIMADSIKKTPEELFQILRESWDITALPFFLNGMCKVLSTYSPEEIASMHHAHIAQTGSTNTSTVKNTQKSVKPKREWYEVTYGNISSLEVTDEVLKKVKKKIVHTKNPHIRYPSNRILKSGIVVFVTACAVRGKDVDPEEIKRINIEFKMTNPI